MGQQPSPGDANRTYLSIIGTTLLLCFAWLLTGSLVLTLMIIALGMLHLARYFPEAEAFISHDPLLVWLRRASPVIIIVITIIVFFAGLRR